MWQPEDGRCSTQQGEREREHYLFSRAEVGAVQIRRHRVRCRFRASTVCAAQIAGETESGVAVTRRGVLGQLGGSEVREPNGLAPSLV